MEEISQDSESVQRLTPVEYQKWLKWGMRGYEHCAQTMERLYNFKLAIYDPTLDMFFKDHRARVDYIRETKMYFPDRKLPVEKSSFVKPQRKKFATAN
jgi:hypothetical protein